MRGKTILEALRLHELDELVARVQAEGQVFDYELKLPDLNERWLRVNAAVISNSAGEREGMILVFHDLTRLKQFERTREEFVANVSHELRTPLSLIKGYVETLLDGARNNPEVAERFLKIIERNTNRLDLLIQDLLTISALESGRMKLNLQPVDLRTVADKVLADLHAKAEAKHVTLTNELPALPVARRRATGWIRCLPIWWTTPSNMAGANGTVTRERPTSWTMAGWRFLCRTTARAFRRRRWTACLSGFIAWTRRVHATRAAPAWGFRLSNTSSTPTAARSGSRANWARARPFSSRCRSASSPLKK